jgi:hypothetical protein
MRREAFLFAGLWTMLACNSGAGNPTSNGAGGSTESGGVAGTGGANSTGGATDTGGPTGTGGAADAGGATGGSPATGGATSVTPSTGGRTAAGGMVGTGGAADAGGATGGTSATGGSAGPVGSGGAGGSAGTGGRNGTGGSGTGTGGSAVDGGTTVVGCDRAGLQAAVDSYLAALGSADTSKMPLASTVKYTEVTSMATANKTTAIGSGLWQTAWPVKFSRSLLDVTGCETFTEAFIPTGNHPYVLGTRLTIKNGEITEIYTLATDSDDWNFDASAYDTCSESEDWSPVPAANQSTREELIAAGEAYFKVFSDKSTAVPWGSPCYRLEGGKGCTPAMDKASTSCNVGIPDSITFKNTHWVVDVELNAAVGITLFGGASPDSHMFRLVNGKIRYIHTLTIMT